MAIRFSILFFFCLLLFSQFGKGEEVKSFENIGDENYISKNHIIGEAHFLTIKPTSYTVEQPESDDSTSQDAEEPEKGFIKKLFSSATKAEKAAKKEAKASKEIANTQVKVYGWYPFWMVNHSADFKYNLLTTLSYFSIEIFFDSITKQISYNDHGMNGSATKDIFNRASRAGCRIDVTFTCYDEKVIDQLLNDVVVQDSCINYLVENLNSNYFIDGVCFVFEHVPANNSASLLNFMSVVKKALGPSNRALKLALPAKDNAHNYDIQKLNTVVDSYILMGYNYHHKGSKMGAVAPLDDKKKNLSIKASVKEYVEKGLPFKKLIVALPYYGIVWKKNSDGRGDYTYYGHWKYSKIANNISIKKPVIQFETLSCTQFYDFEMKGDSFRCYFDNDESLEKKYKWLINQGVAGVGIWALGYDDGIEDFWKMIDKNFKVEKLGPLKKEIIVKNSIKTDTTYFNFRIGSSFVRHQSIKDTLIRDTIFSKIINPDVDTSSAKVEKSWVSVELEKLKTIFEPLLANQKIALTVLLTLIAFGFLGIIASLLFNSVRELLYIRSIPIYILTNITLILIGFSLFSFLGLFKTDVNELIPGFYCQIYKWIWILLLVSWLLINLLSHKLIGSFSLKHEKP